MLNNLIYCLNATVPIFLLMVLGVFLRQVGFLDQQLADKLRISLTHYQNIEYGKALGSIKLWDDLEDIEINPHFIKG